MMLKGSESVPVLPVVNDGYTTYKRTRQTDLTSDVRVGRRLLEHVYAQLMTTVAAVVSYFSNAKLVLMNKYASHRRMY